MLDVLGSGQPFPALKRTNSVATFPQSRRRAISTLVVTGVLELEDEILLRGVEYQLLILPFSQVELLLEFTPLRTGVYEACINYFLCEIRVQRYDVNTFLEHRATPFTQISFSGGRLWTTQQILVMFVSALQLPDEMLQKSLRSRHACRGHRKHVTIASDCSFLESDLEEIFSLTEFSGSEREHYRPCSTLSHANKVAEGAVQRLEKGRRHFGIKKLKATIPLHRKLLSYRY